MSPKDPLAPLSASTLQSIQKFRITRLLIAGDTSEFAIDSITGLVAGGYDTRSSITYWENEARKQA